MSEVIVRERYLKNGKKVYETIHCVLACSF